MDHGASAENDLHTGAEEFVELNHLVGQGERVAEHARVRGRVRLLESADDVLDLLDEDLEDPIALVRDAGATFLAPVFPLLAGVICTGGTLRSHIGIVTRDYGIPCVMRCSLSRDLVQDELIELDLSNGTAVVMAGTPGSGAPGADTPNTSGERTEPVQSKVAGAVVVDPLPRLPLRGSVATPEERRHRANELLAYHSPISHRLTSERTSYSSQMIPVTPYIIVACAEAYLRYPEMIRLIDAALPAEQIGASGRSPGSRINTVYLWSIANFFMVGRKVICGLDPSLDDPEAAFDVLDFWERAAAAFRADGTHQAADDGAVRPYSPETLATAVAALQSVDDNDRTTIARWNATLVNHLFLLHFDTRVGYGDTGPYESPGKSDHTVILRDYYLSHPEFWWAEAAKEVPYNHLVAAFELEHTEVRVTDFGTVVTEPEDYLERLVGFSLFTTDHMAAGELRPVPVGELEAIAAVCSSARDHLYRQIAQMTPREMIECGAHVYFGFLRPFAEAAGIADDLDWSVPKALDPAVVDLLVEMGEQMGDAEMGEETPEGYFPPFA